MDLVPVIKTNEDIRLHVQFRLDRMLSLISDLNIKQFVIDIFSYIPIEAWTRPSSSSGKYHLEDERGMFGNLLHLERDVKICVVIANACSMSAFDKDCLFAGAVLHDDGKYGLDGKSEKSDYDHPIYIRQICEKYNITSGISSNLRDHILSIVEHHMGKWAKQPNVPMSIPRIDLWTALHLADAIESHLVDVL